MWSDAGAGVGTASVLCARFVDCADRCVCNAGGGRDVALRECEPRRGEDGVFVFEVGVVPACGCLLDAVQDVYPRCSRPRAWPARSASAISLRLRPAASAAAAAWATRLGVVVGIPGDVDLGAQALGGSLAKTPMSRSGTLEGLTGTAKGTCLQPSGCWSVRCRALSGHARTRRDLLVATYGGRSALSSPEGGARRGAVKEAAVRLAGARP